MNVDEALDYIENWRDSGGPVPAPVYADVLAAEVRRLRDAVTEARRRHTPDARMGHDDVRCSSCQEESWPCATVRLLGGTEVGS